MTPNLFSEVFVCVGVCEGVRVGVCVKIKARPGSIASIATPVFNNGFQTFTHVNAASYLWLRNAIPNLQKGTLQISYVLQIWIFVPQPTAHDIPHMFNGV